jgi:RTX calcium-binding nonapeptide repeat (4 copies)
MHIRTHWPRVAVALALAATASAIVPALASATKPIRLRVVSSQGQTLAEQRQYSGTTQVPTDPQATCFGQGTGGSGNPVKLKGATALGALAEGAAANKDLKPVSVTDAFAFGLGVCGIGGFNAAGDAFWDVKLNHVESQIGADQIEIEPGDQILWYLTPSFPAPSELQLDAPSAADPGEPFSVTVHEFSNEGNQTPAVGATVTGGDSNATTDSTGTAQVTVAKPGIVSLEATSGPDIPSNQVGVCVQPSGCPSATGEFIFGSSARDRINGTKGPDIIKARAGNDLVRARGGAPKKINCGAGFDVAKISKGTKVKRCNKVVRR